MNIDKLKVGQLLFDVSSHSFGHTTLRTVGVWRVQITEVSEKSFRASWNGNPAQGYFRVPPNWKAKKPYLVDTGFFGKVRKANKNDRETLAFVEQSDCFMHRVKR